MRCARARPVRACFVSKLLRCCPRTGPARDPGAMQRQVTTFLTLRTAFFTPRTPHFTLAHHLSSSHPSSSHLISCLLICQLSSSWLFSFHLRTHTHKVPFIAGCSHFTRKNRRFRAPASSPKQSPFNSHAAITMRFAATRAHPCGHYNAICIQTLQNTKGEPIKPETIQTATAADTQGNPLTFASSLRHHFPSSPLPFSPPWS